MAAVDFITALGRLLHDGKLRDAFSADPLAVAEQIALADSGRSAFLQLVPADLEFQATVLLRKRFDLVREALPKTCGELGDGGWSEFKSYGRTRAGTSGNQTAEDVSGFCMHLLVTCPTALSPVELNRVRFAQSRRRCAFHFVNAVPIHNRRRAGVQIFLRRRPRGWHEWMIYLAA